MNKLILSGALALCMALPAAANTSKIQAVDVEFDLQAIESATAAEFWADLESDLETALVVRVADAIADEGAEIRIDIDEFDMSESFGAALGADSVLKADVNIRNAEDPTKNSFYDLTVTVAQAGDLVEGEAGMEVLTVPTEQIYEAMIQTFADGVVSRLR